jgi:hypothetical protein
MAADDILWLRIGDGGQGARQVRWSAVEWLVVGAVNRGEELRPGQCWMDACDDRKSAWAVSYTTLKTRHENRSQRPPNWTVMKRSFDPLAANFTGRKRKARTKV